MGPGEYGVVDDYEDDDEHEFEDDRFATTAAGVGILGIGCILTSGVACLGIPFLF